MARIEIMLSPSRVTSAVLPSGVKTTWQGPDLSSPSRIRPAGATVLPWMVKTDTVPAARLATRASVPCRLTDTPAAPAPASSVAITAGGVTPRSMMVAVSGAGLGRTFTTPLSSITLLSFEEIAHWAWAPVGSASPPASRRSREVRARSVTPPRRVMGTSCRMVDQVDRQDETTRAFPPLPRRRPRLESHHAPHLGRTRQRLVRGPDATEALQDLGRHGGAAPCRPAHVQRHQFVGGREVARLAVVHLMDVVNALGVEIQQPRGEAQRVPLAYFLVVGDVGLETERGHLPRPPVRPVQAHEPHPLVGGEVEHHHVVAHVHVPVVVDPLRADDVPIRVEGRGNVSHRG